jgi:hypothetical protein
MAVIRSPTLITPGASVEPKLASVIVLTANIMVPGNPPIYTRVVLAAPSLNQLANLSAGYAI